MDKRRISDRKDEKKETEKDKMLKKATKGEILVQKNNFRRIFAKYLHYLDQVSDEGRWSRIVQDFLNVVGNDRKFTREYRLPDLSLLILAPPIPLSDSSSRSVTKKSDDGTTTVPTGELPCMVSGSDDKMESFDPGERPSRLKMESFDPGEGPSRPKMESFDPGEGPSRPKMESFDPGEGPSRPYLKATATSDSSPSEQISSDSTIPSSAGALGRKIREKEEMKKQKQQCQSVETQTTWSRWGSRAPHLQVQPKITSPSVPSTRRSSLLPFDSSKQGTSQQQPKRVSERYLPNISRKDQESSPAKGKQIYRGGKPDFSVYTSNQAAIKRVAAYFTTPQSVTKKEQKSYPSRDRPKSPDRKSSIPLRSSAADQGRRYVNVPQDTVIVKSKSIPSHRQVPSYVEDHPSVKVLPNIPLPEMEHLSVSYVEDQSASYLNPPQDRLLMESQLSPSYRPVPLRTEGQSERSPISTRHSSQNPSPTCTMQRSWSGSRRTLSSTPSPGAKFSPSRYGSRRRLPQIPPLGKTKDRKSDSALLRTGESLNTERSRISPRSLVSSRAPPQFRELFRNLPSSSSPRVSRFGELVTDEEFSIRQADFAFLQRTSSYRGRPRYLSESATEYLV